MSRRLLRAVTLGLTMTIAAAGCGDDDASGPTSQQAEAISTLIDAELSTDEQRCILQGLLDAEIDPETVVDETLTAENDAELIGIAASCVDDLTRIPAFVQSFIDGAAAEGTELSEAEAICAIELLDRLDAAADLAGCIEADNPAAEPEQPDNDTDILDRLSDQCESGNNQACDELYERAPLESDYLETARTCAGQLPDSVGLRCFEDLG